MKSLIVLLALSSLSAFAQPTPGEDHLGRVETDLNRPWDEAVRAAQANIACVRRARAEFLPLTERVVRAKLDELEVDRNVLCEITDLGLERSFADCAGASVRLIVSLQLEPTCYPRRTRITRTRITSSRRQ